MKRVMFNLEEGVHGHCKPRETTFGFSLSCRVTFKPEMFIREKGVCDTSSSKFQEKHIRLAEMLASSLWWAGQRAPKDVNTLPPGNCAQIGLHDRGCGWSQVCDQPTVRHKDHPG